jgi:23S rRNA pseudouridine2457 synthase
MNQQHRYFIVHKPFNMVSQFVSPDDVVLLNQLDFNFPEGTHAIGRLDNHSEGLLLLTTDKRVTRLLFNSETPHIRTYYVQVKNIVSQERLQQLKDGVTIKIENGEDYLAKPTDVAIIPEPILFKRESEEFQQHIPNTWLSITLTEGKFHQIRKMVAAIHHRCRRLIRVSIEDLLLEDLPAGKVKELYATEFFGKLKIKV